MKELLNQRIPLQCRAGAGADLVYLIARKGNIRILEYLVEELQTPLDTPQEHTLITPLGIAAYQGNKDCVELLVENEANINHLTKQGMSPLYLAARKQHYEVVRYLCIFRPVIEFMENRVEHSAFHHAIRHSDLQLLRILLEFKVSPLLLSEEGEIALRIATRNNQEEIVELLCGYMDNYDIENPNDHLTPFMLAVQLEFVTIADILLQSGADPRYKNTHGKDILGIAKDTMNCHALHYLKARNLFRKESEEFKPIECDLIEYNIPSLRILKPKDRSRSVNRSNLSLNSKDSFRSKGSNHSKDSKKSLRLDDDKEIDQYYEYDQKLQKKKTYSKSPQFDRLKSIEELVFGSVGQVLPEANQTISPNKNNMKQSGHKKHRRVVSELSKTEMLNREAFVPEEKSPLAIYKKNVFNKAENENKRKNRKQHKNNKLTKSNQELFQIDETENDQLISPTKEKIHKTKKHHKTISMFEIGNKDKSEHSIEENELSPNNPKSHSMKRKKKSLQKIVEELTVSPRDKSKKKHKKHQKSPDPLTTDINNVDNIEDEKEKKKSRSKSKKAKKINEINKIEEEEILTSLQIKGKHTKSTHKLVNEIPDESNKPSKIKDKSKSSKIIKNYEDQNILSAPAKIDGYTKLGSEHFGNKLEDNENWTIRVYQKKSSVDPNQDMRKMKKIISEPNVLLDKNGQDKIDKLHKLSTNSQKQEKEKERKDLSPNSSQRKIKQKRYTDFYNPKEIEQKNKKQNVPIPNETKSQQHHKRAYSENAPKLNDEITPKNINSTKQRKKASHKELSPSESKANNERYQDKESPKIVKNESSKSSKYDIKTDDIAENKVAKKNRIISHLHIKSVNQLLTEKRPEEEEKSGKKTPRLTDNIPLIIDADLNKKNRKQAKHNTKIKNVANEPMNLPNINSKGLKKIGKEKLPDEYRSATSLANATKKHPKPPIAPLTFSKSTNNLTKLLTLKKKKKAPKPTEEIYISNDESNFEEDTNFKLNSEESFSLSDTEDLKKQGVLKKTEVKLAPVTFGVCSRDNNPSKKSPKIDLDGDYIEIENEDEVDREIYLEETPNSTVNRSIRSMRSLIGDEYGYLSPRIKPNFYQYLSTRKRSPGSNYNFEDQMNIDVNKSADSSLPTSNQLKKSASIGGGARQRGFRRMDSLSVNKITGRLERDYSKKVNFGEKMEEEIEDVMRHKGTDIGWRKYMAHNIMGAKEVTDKGKDLLDLGDGESVNDLYRKMSSLKQEVKKKPKRMNSHTMTGLLKDGSFGPQAKAKAK